MSRPLPIPFASPPLRLLLIAGSPRGPEHCAARESKSSALVRRLAERVPAGFIVDVEDLANARGHAQIRACSGCVSTSKALCCWPCNCYGPGDGLEPDLMWDHDLYARLERADAWAIVGPVHWNAPSSGLKLLFDRLVCMSGGNPRPELIDGKDPAKAVALEKSARWRELTANHLEGRTAAFFCFGDEGGEELDESGRPKILRHHEWLEPKHDPYWDTRLTYAPLVLQCRYSGIEVPDELWRYAAFRGAASEGDVLRAFDEWAGAFVRRVAAKGKVEPSRFSAIGVRPLRRVR